MVCILQTRMEKKDTRCFKMVPCRRIEKRIQYEFETVLDNTGYKYFEMLKNPLH